MSHKFLAFKSIFLAGLLSISSNIMAQLCLTPATLNSKTSQAFGSFAIDVNKDGKIDLLTANGATNSFSVFLNDGKTPLAASTNYDAVGTTPIAISAIDCNKDLYPDIVIANQVSGTVSVYLNNKANGFTFNKSITVDGNLTDITTDDFDNNGYGDIAVTSRAKNFPVYVLMNNGKGGFTVLAAGDPKIMPTKLASGDLNKDGIRDIAVSHDTGVEVLFGAGDGTFKNSNTLSVNGLGQGIVIGDLDADGAKDLVLANNGYDLVSILMGVGGGNFEKPIKISAGKAPWSVGIADLDGDGALDIAVTSTDGLATIYGDGKGKFGTASYYTGYTTLKDLAIGDFYADGKIDAALTTPGNTADVILLKNNGASPTITTNPSSTTVCAGNSVTLRSVGTKLPVWDNGITEGVAFTPTISRTYTVSDFNASTGCLSKASAIVTVSPLPTVTATGATYCVGDGAAQISASGALNYTWTPSGGLSNAKISNPLANPTGTTTYTVTGTNAAGCSATATATVTVGFKPSISATGGSFCEGGTGIQLNATGAGSTGTYSWSPSATLSNANISNPIATPTITTTYTVTGTLSGCSNTASATVIVNPKPVVSTTGATMCIGATGVTISASGAGTGGTYNWSPKTGLSSTTISSPTATPSTTTNYIVTVTDANNCSNTGNATVIVNQNPTITASGGAFCAGSAGVSINASGGISYTWTPGTTLSDPKSPNPIATPSTTSTYTVKGTDANGCSATATTTVTVNQLPKITASSDAFCAGGTGVTIIASGAGTGGSYTWSPTLNLSAPNIANPIAKPSTTTTYTVTGKDANGCSATANSIVTVHPLPSISATGGSYCIGSAGVTLNATGGDSYTWSPITNLSNPSIATPIATPTSTTNYTVTGTNKYGCNASAIATVNVNNAPTASISGAATICSGNSTNLSFTLTGKSPWTLTYLEGTASVTLSNITSSPYLIAVTPLTTTTYSLSTITDANCSASISGSATIKVNTTPSASIVETAATICSGNSTNITFTLNGAKPWDLTFTDGSKNSSITGISSSPYTLTVTPSGDAIYAIKSITSNGCNGTFSGALNLKVNPLPIATISGNNSVCAGGNSNIQVDFSAGAKPWYIEYNDGGATKSIGGITTSPYTITIINPTSTKNYKLSKVTDNNTCVGDVSASGSAIVSVNPTPTALLSNTGTVCQGSSNNLTLNLTGTKPWNITYNHGGTSTTLSGITASPYQFTVTPGNNNDYTLATVNDLNCSGNASGTVKVQAAPVAVLSGNKTICNGNSTSIDLNISGGSSPWSISYTDGVSTFTNNNIFSSPYALHVSPSSTTTYTLSSITSSAGCAGTFSGSSIVTVNPAATAKISGTTSICIGKTATITVDFTGKSPWSMTYYDQSTSTTINGISSSSYTFTVSPTSTRTYSISSFSDANACSAVPIGNAVVTVLSSSDPLCVCTTSAVLSGGGQICATESLPLTIQLTGTPPWTLNYSAGGVPNIVAISTTPYTLNVSPIATTVYTLNSVSNLSCSGSASGTATVTVNQAPSVSLSSNKTICEGDVTTITATFTGTGPYNFSYTDGTTATAVTGITSSTYSFSVSPSITSIYSIQNLTGNGGCIGTTLNTCIVTVKAKPNLTGSTNVTICEGEKSTLPLVLSGTGPWSFTYSDGSPAVTITNILTTAYTLNVNPLSSKTYTFTSVTDANCTASINVQKLVNVNPLPIVKTNYTGATSICAGQQLTLNATGANVYTWTGGINNGIPFTPLSQKYTVTGTDLNGCSSKDSVTFNVNALPKVSVTSTDTIVCIGDKVTLNASGDAMAYNWTGGIINNVPFIPSVSQQYILTAINSALCQVKDTINITVKSAPLTKANASSLSVCKGDSVILTGLGDAAGYTWTNGVSNAKAFAILSTQKYVVTGTTGTCTSTDSLTVTVNNLPTVKANASATTVCSDQKITLTGSGTASIYTWSDLVIDGIPFSPNTKQYIVTGDNGICKSKDSISITVNKAPVVTLTTTSNSICELESVVLTATGATNYTWNNSLPTLASHQVQPSINTNYQVIGTSNGCADTASTLIVVHAKPNVTASIGNTNLCAGESTSLSVTGALSYLWNNGLGTITTSTITPTTTTTYEAIGSDVHGCKDTSSVTVNVTPIPTLSVAAGSLNICGGTATSIATATDVPSIISWTISASNVNGASAGNSGITPLNNFNIVQSLSNTAKNGAVTYSITALNGTCSSIAQHINVTVDTCLVLPDFKVDRTITCSFDSVVTYTDHSIGAITWSWDFGTDATPSTATGKGPHKIKYSTNGVKSTQLTTTGLGGTNSVTASKTKVNALARPTINSPITDSSFTQDSVTVLSKSSIITNATGYHWSSTPSVGINFSDTSFSTIGTFLTDVSGKIKINVYASNDDGCKSAYSDTVTIIRHGNVSVKPAKYTLFNNDSTDVTVDFAGTPPFTFGFEIGSNKTTFTDIKNKSFSFKIGDIGTIKNIFAYDKDNVSLILKTSTFTIRKDTVSKVSLSTVAGGCTGGKGKLLVNVTGGKAPYILNIDGADFTIKAIDTLLLDAGTKTLTIKDAAGYISKNSFSVNITGGTTDLSNIKPQLSSKSYTYTLVNGDKIYPTIDIKNTVSALQYQWSYLSENNIVDSISNSSDSTGVINLKYRLSGKIKISAKGYSGTCSTQQSDTITITIKPFVKDVTSKDTLKYELYGSAPFYLTMKINEQDVTDTVNSNSIWLIKNNINSLVFTQIKDAQGNLTDLPQPYLNEPTYGFWDGISPNGDDKNETLVIKNYFTNDGTLYIYDQNGFEIHKVSNYKNDWPNRANNDAIPENGLYFVVFKCKGNTIHGAIEIRK